MTDVNEFDPVVDEQTFAVAENSANGTVVGMVAASDADTSQTLTFAITAGNESGAFAINASTGQITVADSTKLDHEAVAQFALSVQVTDSGVPPRSATGAITIDVTDVNEFHPVVDEQTFAVAENSPNGTVVGIVAASDADTSQTLTFAITAGNSSGAFAINAGTGQITVADSMKLDHEAVAQFVLTVQVTDSGVPPRSATSTITIDYVVNPVNEPPTALVTFAPDVLAAIGMRQTTGRTSRG